MPTGVEVVDVGNLQVSKMHTILTDYWFLAAALSQLLLVMLGAVVSLAEDWAKRHKGLLLPAFLILGTVGLITAAEQAGNSAIASTKLDKALGELQASTREIGRMTGLNTRLQEKLVEQGATISGLAHQAVNSVTGGDSFCFMTLAQDQKTLLIYNPADYPLTDVELDLQDYTSSREDHFRRQTVSPHQSWPYRYELTSGDRDDFFITFSAVNGAWFETLQLRKVNGAWEQALRVERFPKRVKLDGTTKPKIMREYVDALYPREPSKEVQWCQFMFSKPTLEPNPCIPPAK